MRPTNDNHDRRRHPRQPQPGGMRVLLLNSDFEPVGPLPVRVRDVSRGGLGLLSSLAIPVGRYFMVRVTAAGLRPLVYQVLRCERVHGGGLYRIGARFEPAAIVSDVADAARASPLPAAPQRPTLCHP